MPNANQTDLIDRLVADLQPTQPMRRTTGWALVAAATLMTVAVVVALASAVSTLQAVRLSAPFLIANGLLLILGVSAATAVIAMASPSVGVRNDGPKWAMGMAAVFPIAAALLLVRGVDAGTLLGAEHSWRCTLMGTLASALVAGTLIVWLRRGAPVSLRRAGVYLGVAAGALGSVSYSLACPLDTIYHLGIWHFLPVAICALIGAITVPKLARW